MSEEKTTRKEKKVMLKEMALLLLFGIVLIAFLVVFRGGITGLYALNTVESDVFVSGSSREGDLGFEKIPDFIAYTEEEIRFKIEPNTDNVDFYDDTRLFNISQEGVIEFTPTSDDIGKHNVWIIIKDDSGRYYYQNVAIFVEER